MRLARQLLGRLVIAPAVLLLAACSPAPVPPTPTVTPLPPAAPTAASTPTLAPTATPTVRPVASPAPTSDPYSGWELAETADLSIRLPQGWRAVDAESVDAMSMLEQLRKEQPLLADMAGGTETLKGAAFLALGPERDGLADSLIIFRAPLGAERITNLETQVVDVVARQYEKLGFAPRAGLTNARTEGSLPLAALEYRMGGEGIAPLAGRQFYVATDTDLWILTFTAFLLEGAIAPPEGEAFARSASSFTPRQP